MAKNSFSNKVYIYTFLLSVLVVLVHSVNFASDNSTLLLMIQSSDLSGTKLGGMTGIPAHIENFLSNALGQAAVPGFFMMSGYLFFRTLGGFRDIGRKWKERFFTLVMPYGAWNVIYYLAYVICGRAKPGLKELADAAVNYRYNPVFWYLFQLILLTILAPLFFALLKNRLLCILSFVIYVYAVFRCVDIPYINEDAVIYYFAGAALSGFRKQHFESIKSGGCLVGIFLLFLSWGSQIFTTVGMQNFVIAPVNYEKMGLFSFWYMGGQLSLAMGRWLSGLPQSVLVGILSEGGQIIVNVLRRLAICLGLWYVLPVKLPEASKYMKNSFFLYAVHYPIARAGIFMLEYMNVGYHGVNEQIIRLCVYLFIPVICIALSYRSKLLLKKYIPFAWNILSGGR